MSKKKIDVIKTLMRIQGAPFSELAILSGLRMEEVRAIISDWEKIRFVKVTSYKDSEEIVTLNQKGFDAGKKLINAEEVLKESPLLK